MSIYQEDTISAALGLRPINIDWSDKYPLFNPTKDINGELNPFYGLKHTKESKKRMSKKRKGKNTFLDKDGNYVYGDVSVIDYVNFFPRQYKKVYVEDVNGNRFHVSKEDPRFETGEIFGLNKGKKGLADHLNKKDHTCIHCGFVSTKGNIIRWHNNNCRMKTNE